MTGKIRLEANGVYDDGALVAALGLTYATLARARRADELRYTRKGKRVLYRGSWVLDWLEHDGDNRGGGGDNE